MISQIWHMTSLYIPKVKEPWLHAKGFNGSDSITGNLTGCVLKMVGILSGFQGDVTVTFWSMVIFCSHDPIFKVPHRITLNASRFNFKSIWVTYKRGIKNTIYGYANRTLTNLQSFNLDQTSSFSNPKNGSHSIQHWWSSFSIPDENPKHKLSSWSKCIFLSWRLEDAYRCPETITSVNCHV